MKSKLGFPTVSHATCNILSNLTFEFAPCSLEAFVSTLMNNNEVCRVPLR